MLGSFVCELQAAVGCRRDEGMWTMSKVRSLVAAVVTALLVGAGLFATAGVSAAAPVYKFRLSQFAAIVAEVCVQTDVDRVCVTWGANRSEVFDVRANSLHNWMCQAYTKPTGVTWTMKGISRTEFKECGVFGRTAFDANLKAKRPDGSLSS